MNNLHWYYDRFDDYNNAINSKIASLASNPNPGTVPIMISDIVAFIDGNAENICRAWVINKLVYFIFNFCQIIILIYYI